MSTACPSQDNPHPLALLDMQLPDLDGIALARTIKADPLLAPIRLVLMSLFAQCDDSVWETGIALYLHKPVRQSALYDILLAAMGKALTFPFRDLRQSSCRLPRDIS